MILRIITLPVDSANVEEVLHLIETSVGPAAHQQPVILDFLNTTLCERHIKATGALEVLTQYAEQVLALCEEYPDNEPIHQLLESVRADLVARHEERQATVVHITQLEQPLSGPPSNS